MGKRLTQEEFLARAKAAHEKDGYDYSETVYVNRRTKICYRCPKHGLQWQLPENHVAYGCKDCGDERAADKKRLTQEEIIERFHKAHGNDYDYSLVDYKNIDTPVKIICRKNNHTFKQSPYEHENGAKCPYCHGFYRTTADFIKDARAIHGDRYDYSQCQYVNATTPMPIRCIEHNQVSWLSYNEHVTNKRVCSCCVEKTYKGEKKIKEYLETHNIPYIPQKTFDDLKDSKSLHFDFYLPTYNLAIEYDGRQHFEPVDFGGGMENAEAEFQNTIKHDKMKQKYCSTNNINLLRINYNEYDNIENILSERI